MEMWETRQQQLLEFLNSPTEMQRAALYEALFVKHYLQEATQNEQLYPTLDLYFQGALNEIDQNLRPRSYAEHEQHRFRGNR